MEIGIYREIMAYDDISEPLPKMIVMNNLSNVKEVSNAVSYNEIPQAKRSSRGLFIKP